MKVNTSSWHYRTLKWLGTAYGNSFQWDPPTSLCSYFWSFPLHALRVTLCSSIIALAASYFPICVYSWLHNGSAGAKGIVLGTLVVAGFIALMCGFFLAKDRIEQRDDGTARLVLEFVKAKKNRVCPLITYVSSNEGKENG